ncbi:MAG: ATP-binding cassette domain-containing protein [Tissierellia bacterium]|nr:ATP-binding cassette domain-containing protein [Tissierellia bacterium]
MIELRNISKSYDKEILKEVNLIINKVSRVGIIGSSGEGKTTLIRIILGLEKPDFGEVIMDDLKMSAVFQEDRLIANLPAIDNIKIIDDSIQEKDIISHLNEVGIVDYDMRINKMSGGMKRRVAIVRAVICKSDIIILDEPIKGLDGQSRANTIEYINKYKGDRALVLVTHDEADLLDFQIEKILDLDKK